MFYVWSTPSRFCFSLTKRQNVILITCKSVTNKEGNHINNSVSLHRNLGQFQIFNIANGARGCVSNLNNGRIRAQGFDFLENCKSL